MEVAGGGNRPDGEEGEKKEVSIDGDHDDERLRELNDERVALRKVLRPPLAPIALWVKVIAGLVLLLVVMALTGLAVIAWRAL